MMSSDLVTQIAQPAHLSEVAEIHYRSLPEDFLPSLGLDFLKRVYYPAALQSQYAVTLVALKDGHPVGFVTIAHDANRFYRDILCRKLFLLVTCALRAMLRDLGYWRKVLEVFWSSVAGRSDSIKGEIVFIAVDELHRGHGAGKRLVVAALDYLRHKGVRFCRTKTLAQNIGVIRMYEEMNWRVRDRFRLIGREYVTVVVELAGDDQVSWGKDTPSAI